MAQPTLIPEAKKHKNEDVSWRGDETASELTVRAVLSGLVVGSLIGASNVCIGLKIGWTFGASITAAVISFALFKTFAKVLSRPYGAKENLITATAGSAAGTVTGLVLPLGELVHPDGEGLSDSCNTNPGVSGVQEISAKPEAAGATESVGAPEVCTNAGSAQNPPVSV